MTVCTDMRLLCAGLLKEFESYNMINSFFILIGTRGPGVLAIVLVLGFIIAFDKIVKLIIYIGNKIEERKRKKRV